MKKYFIANFLVVLSLTCTQNLFAKDLCNLDETIGLSVFHKNDYKFYNYVCDSDEGGYFKSYLGNQKDKIFLGEYSDMVTKESPRLLAVSIYRSKKEKPLLITINSSYYCCTPQIEGNMYKINFYQIILDKEISLKNVTNIFGQNAEGFEGQTEGRVFYHYKTVAEIKKWLDKNYHE